MSSCFKICAMPRATNPRRSGKFQCWPRYSFQYLNSEIIDGKWLNAATNCSFFFNLFKKMKFNTVHFPSGKPIKRFHGKGVSGGSLLLKQGLGATYDSVQEYKGLVKETRGAGLTESAMKRLESLRPKALSETKRQNIKFSI